MTEDELQDSFCDFNSRYFGGQLNCKVIVTDDWIDADADGNRRFDFGRNPRGRGAVHVVLG